MERIVLTDGSGRWFDGEKAERFKEETWWNGNNWISYATGSQFEHEALYRTKGGKWILSHSSDYQGRGQSYREIENEEAAKWLSINKWEAHKACEKEYKRLEIE